ncbi:MAG: alpha-glucan family phosphorylase [Bacteroidia bacterium]|nr:alpha-glucan family phosphorylase [Bacteroidia bacterium]MCX7652442.1 alpha-glucan family phosphorylase [Bacteroidia bacterium]MDW8416843.1 alpha-glucan family phosphorylase [Bacteroidia bacterium]
MKDEPILSSKVSLLFEVSWEVANKVGGIYTVLVGKAPIIHRQRPNSYWLIGPYLPGKNSAWESVPSLYGDWREYFLREKGIPVHAGYWHISEVKVPTLLIDFYPALAKRNDLFANWWEKYGVESLWGGWDYIEPAIFGYAAGEVIQSFRRFYYEDVEAIAHFHEWLTGAGILHLRECAPSITTVFTTHATVAGRAAGGAFISHNQLGFWLRERNILSKHTLEKAAWQQADITTTVSEIVSREAAHYLGRGADIITPNGWQSPKDIPTKDARIWLCKLADKWGWSDSPPFWLLHSGRPELENKGTLTLIRALSQYRHSSVPHRNLAVIFAMPGDAERPHAGAYEPLWVSHVLRFPENDRLLRELQSLNLTPEDPVRIAYLPVYLEGEDGVLNLPYYALLGAVDATAFPSRYEPWGYTPQESLGMGVPTLSTRQAGFGAWMMEHVKPLPEALSLIDYDQASPEEQILFWLRRRLETPKEQQVSLRREALLLAERTTWSYFLPFYQQAYQIAIAKTQARLWYRLAPPPSAEKKTFIWHRAFFLPTLPEELKPLHTLAYNLWWSWNPDAQNLFRLINPEAWEKYENPVWLLNHTPSHRWETLSREEDFLKQLRQIHQRFQNYMSQPLSPDKPAVAYLCMEYGITKCLPFYSGGLGVLAGDYLKEASDQGYPMVGIGILYRRGYFQQRISPDGEQLAETPNLRFTDLPLEPVRTDDGRWLHLRLSLGGHPILLKVWRVRVGRISLYLLDADLSENPPELREVTARLYEGDTERRLQQEIVLGFGAQALLNALNHPVDLFHYNEGHPAFHIVAFWLHLHQKGLTIRAAQEETKLRVLFTTHTPVPAGHDAFSPELLQKYLYEPIQQLDIGWEKFLEWGKMPDQGDKFSLTAFCLRFAGFTNGVSRLHARVSKSMFAGLYQGYLPQEVPIEGITNGVHISTWQAPEWNRSRRTWETHQTLRSTLIGYLRRRLLSEPGPVRHLEAIRAFFAGLDDSSLLVGFARRFATYKRHGLLFEHDSLRKLFAEEPTLRLLIAGKAHPRDEAGKAMLRSVWQKSLEPPFLGKVLFIPDYDMQVARYLVQGVDVWLNLPIYGHEASGTSGMKAALNGVLHLSIPDGWWAEVSPEEAGGWSLPICTSDDPEIRDAWEATQLSYLLREEVLPLYKARDARGIPMQWLARMEKSQSYAAQHFSTQRMLTEYEQRLYIPAQERLRKLSEDLFKERLDFLSLIEKSWENIRIEYISVPPFAERAYSSCQPFSVELKVEAPDMPTETLRAEIVFENAAGTIHAFPLQSVGEGRFQGEIEIPDAGVYHYAIRLYAWDPYLEMRLWEWVKVV